MHTHTHTHTPKCCQTVFGHHSARVRLHELEPGWWRVDYFGLVTPQAFAGLRRKVIEVTRGADALTLHVDKAVFAMAQAPGFNPALFGSAPVSGVIVARQDQHAMLSRYSDALARQGIMRMVFLPDQYWQADAVVQAIRFALAARRTRLGALPQS